MAMTQRDDTIEAIKRLDGLLEYAVMHGDETEVERIREERAGGCVGFAEGCGGRGASDLPKRAGRFGGVAKLNCT